MHIYVLNLNLSRIVSVLVCDADSILVIHNRLAVFKI